VDGRDRHYRAVQGHEIGVQQRFTSRRRNKQDIFTRCEHNTFLMDSNNICLHAEYSGTHAMCRVAST